VNMDEAELAARTARLPDTFADRLPRDALRALRIMADGGEWGEMLDLLLAVLSQAGTAVTAAERTGAVLAVAGNLYGYGPVDGPITDTTPLAATHPKLRLRADMWREALARHEAGRLRVTEIRSSDYVEANSILTFVLAKPIRAGKRAFVPGALDVPHSWTTIGDAARALVTVATAVAAFNNDATIDLVKQAMVDAHADARAAGEVVEHVGGDACHDDSFLSTAAIERVAPGRKQHRQMHAL